jgi:hypothetical protein
MKTKIIIVISVAVFLLLLGIIAAIHSWYADLPKLTTQWQVAPEIKSLTKTPQADVALKEIVTLQKKEAAKKLKLPEAIANDPTKHILKAAKIPPYEGDTDVTAIMTIIDGEGKTEIIAQPQPLSLFALENKRAIGLRYGYGSKAAADSVVGSGMEADVYVRWDILRIGGVHVGLYGEVASTGDGKAMLNAEYRF